MSRAMLACVSFSVKPWRQGSACPLLLAEHCFHKLVDHGCLVRVVAVRLMVVVGDGFVMEECVVQEKLNVRYAALDEIPFAVVEAELYQNIGVVSALIVTRLPTCFA